ncbi:MAG: lasso peptide [Nostoc sp. TH1S01]|nr:lasso peptide [Nostoc sp. TH1S01]
MKKLYCTPKLTDHGDISTITNISGGGTRQDVLFGPPKGSTVISNGQGSADDGCLIKPGTKVCL